MTSTLAIFDLDFTLLEGDCETLWSEFLVREKVLPLAYLDEVDAIFDAYQNGRMDIRAYQELIFRPLLEIDTARLLRLREKFMQDFSCCFRPYMRKRVAWHAAQGHALLVVTLANSFIAAPIVAQLGIPHLIATPVEMRDGKISGVAAAEPPYGSGKVRLYRAWLAGRQMEITESWGYSDSRNDLPLLESVTHAIAVTPDAALRALALERKWEILSPKPDSTPGAGQFQAYAPWFSSGAGPIQDSDDRPSSGAPFNREGASPY